MNQQPFPCYCLRMRRASQQAAVFYNRILAPSGVTARQYFLLQTISRLGPCSVRQLAEAAELDRSTLSRSLKPLREQGLTADRKAAGAKSSRLELTDKGRTALDQAQALWQQAQWSLEERAGPQGVEALERVFAVLEGLQASDSGGLGQLSPHLYSNCQEEK